MGSPIDHIKRKSSRPTSPFMLHFEANASLLEHRKFQWRHGNPSRSQVCRKKVLSSYANALTKIKSLNKDPGQKYH